MEVEDPARSVETALLSRRSVRAFLPDPVDPAILRRILHAAARAPSGTNMQPWHAYVLTGAIKRTLTERALALRDLEPERERPPSPAGEYVYNPEPLFAPYLERRRAVGWSLYSLLGVARGDRAGSWAASGRNFEWYGAPVGMIFTIDRKLERGSWLDHGMFLQSIMLAARDFGLDTCAQAAWRHYHDVIRPLLGIPEEQIVVCGMSLGVADPLAAVNRLATEREPLDSFATFLEEDAHAPV